MCCTNIMHLTQSRSSTSAYFYVFMSKITLILFRKDARIPNRLSAILPTSLHVKKFSLYWGDIFVFLTYEWMKWSFLLFLLGSQHWIWCYVYLLCGSYGPLNNWGVLCLVSSCISTAEPGEPVYPVNTASGRRDYTSGWQTFSEAWEKSLPFLCFAVTVWGCLEATGETLRVKEASLYYSLF